MKIADKDREHFWAKVEKADGDGCWTWTGNRRRDGYGLLWLEDRKAEPSPRLAHRISWEIHFGPTPSGMLLCHRCDNPACVRPDHLFLGTNADNAHDCMAKGRRRYSRGENAHPAKLTNKDVCEIRRRLAAGTYGICAALAREYGVSEGAIRHIKKGRQWKSVGG